MYDLDGVGDFLRVHKTHKNKLVSQFILERDFLVSKVLEKLHLNYVRILVVRMEICGFSVTINSKMN